MSDEQSDKYAEVARLARRSGAFWNLVDSSEKNGCWLWLGHIRGQWGHGGFDRTAAHRFSWALHNGGYPDAGLVVRHKCDNPVCVNPKHLEVGTQKDNVADMVDRGRGWWQNDSCKHGHPRTIANTFYDRKGYKECLECRKIWWDARNAEPPRRARCRICGFETLAKHRPRHERTHLGTLSARGGKQ